MAADVHPAPGSLVHAVFATLANPPAIVPCRRAMMHRDHRPTSGNAPFTMPRAVPRLPVTLSCPRRRWRVPAALALLLACLLPVSAAVAKTTATIATTPPTTVAETPDAAAYRRDFYFLRLDSNDGLVQNSVSLLHQDRIGYMWLATQGGLFRFDGYKLRRYAHDPDQADSLPEDFLVTAMADANENRLWVGTLNSGLILFDPVLGRTLPLPAEIHRPGLTVTSLLRLPDGALLVASTRGLDRLSPAPRPQLQPLWREQADGREWLRSLTRCPDGRIYAYAGNRILSVGDGSAASKVLPQSNPGDIGALYCGPDNRLLLGDDRGLSLVDRDTGATTLIWQAALPGIAVRAIMADHDRHLWLALSDHTLLRMGPGAQTQRVAPAPVGIPGGLPDARIETLLVDRTGMLWVGTATAGAVRTRSEGSPIQSVLKIGRAHV